MFIQRIRLLPNPARFTLNGVHVAVSSVDVLFHLRKEEYFKRAPDVEPLTSPPDPEGQTPTDAMANLCRHLLQQRRYASLAWHDGRQLMEECGLIVSIPSSLSPSTSRMT